jgi:putative ABC transport system ATP-binding protein
VSVREVRKTYSLGETEVHALRGITVSIGAGEFVAIMGASGSGKSTFMNILGCLDRPTSGEYWLEGTDVSRLNKKELAHIRNQKIGFVFQGFNLLGRTTALENTELPMLYSRVSKKEREERAREALTLVGLGDRLDHFLRRCRAVSNSGSQSRGRWSTSQGFCSPTNLPATSTVARP